MSRVGDTSSSPGYEALISGVASLVDGDRALLRIEGPKSVDLLGGLLSADIEALEPGDLSLTFVLTPKGRPIAVPTVVRLDDAVLLDVSRTALPGLLDHFGTYLPPRFAAVTVLEDGCRVSLLGPGAREVVDDLDVEQPHIRIARASEDGGGFDYYFPECGSGPEVLEAAALAAGGAVPTEEDLETWRIELGIPRFGIDVTEDNLPQETGLAGRAVSFEKGCYTGQEVVARIHYRGHVNRHLRGIRLENPAAGADPLSPLEPGTEVTVDGRVVGVVTSSCASPRFGPIALAYVRREVAPGDLVEAVSEASSAWLIVDTPFTSS